MQHKNIKHSHKIGHATTIVHATQKQTNKDACTPQWNDIKIALKAKTETDPTKAKEMLEKTHYKQNLGSDLKVSPTAGIIWDLKDPPGWDEVS